MDDDERGSKPGVAPCDDLNTGSPNPHLKLLATYVVLGYRLQNSLQAHSDPLLSLNKYGGTLFTYAKQALLCCS